jgi:hypothetical protein
MFLVYYSVHPDNGPDFWKCEDCNSLINFSANALRVRNKIAAQNINVAAPLPEASGDKPPSMAGNASLKPAVCPAAEATAGNTSKVESVTPKNCSTCKRDEDSCRFCIGLELWEA